MRVLLVNPYIYDFSAYDLWLRPLGLLYISSVIRKFSDAEIFYIDALDRFQWEGSSKSRSDGRGKFSRELVKKPDIYKSIPRNYSRYGIPVEIFENKLNELPEVDLVLLTSLMTYWTDGVTYTIELLKKRFPDALYFLGGIIPTLSGANIAELYSVDGVIRGYGEESVLELLKAKGVKIKAFPDFKNPDNLPLPAVDLLGSAKYLPLMTSRGCPCRCTYCASSILNPGFFERSAEKIIDEIFTHYDKFGTRHFTIFDDAFLVNKHKRFFPVFQEVSKLPDISFHTPNGLHTREIDCETAEVLFAAGFKTLRLSFESTSPDILQRSDKKVTVDKMAQAVENLVNAGFGRENIDCYLLFGLPGQKPDDIYDSIDYVRSLGINPKLSWYSPVPGTQDYFRLQNEGKIPRDLNLLQTNKLYYIYTLAGYTHNDIKSIAEYARKT